MCCGCPVIASDRVGAGQDLIAPVCEDFIFPTGNVERLCEILNDALSDLPRLRELGRASTAHLATWSPMRNIASTVEAIEKAVCKRGERRRRQGWLGSRKTWSDTLERGQKSR